MNHTLKARNAAKLVSSQPDPEESPQKGSSMMRRMSGMIAEKKTAAWTATTNITSKSVFGFLSATSLELQMLEVCKAMGCSFEQDDSIKPKQYIGKLTILLLLN